MANPYSIPSNFTYTPLPLEKFAEVIKQKQGQFDITQAGLEDVKAGLKFTEGLSTKGFAETNKAKYQKPLEELSLQLMEGESPTVIARRALALRNQYENDPNVLAAARDAEVSPAMIKARTDNPGAYIGWEDDQKNIKQLEYGKISPTDVDIHYGNMAAAPTFDQELKYWSLIPEKERQQLGEYVQKAATDGTFLGWEKMDLDTKTKLLKDLSPQLENALKTAYKNKQMSSNFYNASGKGYDQYLTDALSYLKPLEVNNEKRSASLVSAPKDGSGSGSGSSPDAVAGIKIVTGPSGVIQGALTNFSGDNIYEAPAAYQELQNTYSDLVRQGKTQEAEELYNSPEAAQIKNSHDYYQTVKANYDAVEGSKIWEKAKKTTNVDPNYTESTTGYENRLAEESARVLSGKEEDSPYSEKVRNAYDKVFKYKDGYLKHGQKPGERSYTIFSPEYLNKIFENSTEEKAWEYLNVQSKAWNKTKEIAQKQYDEGLKNFTQDKYSDIQRLSLMNLSPAQEQEYQKGAALLFKPGLLETSSLELYTTSDEGDLELKEFDKSEGEKEKQKVLSNVGRFLNTPKGLALLDTNSVAVEKGDRGTYAVYTLPATIDENGQLVVDDTGTKTTTFRARINPKAAEEDIKAPGKAGTVENFLGFYSGMTEGVGTKEPTYDVNQFGLPVGDDLAYNSMISAIPTANADYINTTAKNDPTALSSVTKTMMPKQTEVVNNALNVVTNNFGREIKPEYKVNPETDYLMFGDKFTGDANNTVIYKGNKDQFTKTGKLESVDNLSIYTDLMSMDDKEIDTPFNHAMVMQLVSSIQQDIQNNPNK
jgi:hypothetical protein